MSNVLKINSGPVVTALKGTSKNPNFVVILRCSEIFIAYSLFEWVPQNDGFFAIRAG